eukprot:92137-Amphidinium_carterae.1
MPEHGWPTKPERRATGQLASRPSPKNVDFDQDAELQRLLDEQMAQAAPPANDNSVAAIAQQGESLR